LASAVLADLLHGDFDLCEQIACPLLVKPPDCDPATCATLDTERRRRGAVYMIRGDGADFVALLPRVKA
jgi:hypothetical protein